MEQTFNDLCRERKDAKGGLLGFVLWTFVETSVGIIKENLMKGRITMLNVISWILGITFFAIGALNLVLVHPVPGVFYLLLSFVYFLPANAILRKRIGLSIPLVINIILGLVILWATLAVGELAEMFGL